MLVFGFLAWWVLIQILEQGHEPVKSGIISSVRKERRSYANSFTAQAHRGVPRATLQGQRLAKI